MGVSIFQSLGQPAMPTQGSQGPQNGVMQFMSAMQQVSQMMRGAQSPMMLAKQYFPDIPDEYMNNPEQALAFVQQRYGIDSGTVQQLRQMMGV